MINQVNRIIANRLLKRESVYLPTIGSLYVESRPATFVNKKEIAPPLRVVEFSTEQRGLSLIQIITTVASIDQAHATDIYTRWLESVKSEKGVVIGDIGVLSEKFFIMNDDFAEMLNPQSLRVLKKSSGGHKFVWGVAVFAILLSLYIVAQFAEDLVFGKASTFVENEPVKSVQEVALVEDIASEKSVEEVALVEGIAPEKSVETAPVKSEISQIDSLVPNRYYVVLGVFSSKINALRACKESDLEDRCVVYYYGSQFLTTVYSSDEESKVEDFKSKYRTNLNELWVYRAK